MSLVGVYSRTEILDMLHFCTNILHTLTRSACSKHLSINSRIECLYQLPGLCLRIGHYRANIQDTLDLSHSGAAIAYRQSLRRFKRRGTSYAQMIDEGALTMSAFLFLSNSASHCRWTSDTIARPEYWLGQNSDIPLISSCTRDLARISRCDYHFKDESDYFKVEEAPS
jgi:hypothetical protein